MQKNDGITMVVLIVTIVLMIILAGVTISAGTGAYESAQMSGFVSRMNIIQAQVNIAHTKKTNGDANVESYGQEMPSYVENKMATIVGEEDLTGYRYFTKDDLKSDLDIDGVDETVIINFDTRKVYSLNGIEYKSKMYYTQYDLPGGQYNIGYEDPVVASKPSFEVEKLNYSTYTTINIKNIVYNSNTNSGTAYYGIVTNQTNDNVEVNYWQAMSNNVVNSNNSNDNIDFTVDVNKSAKYAIKFVDKANNDKIEVVDVVIANEPELVNGMNPVIYDEAENMWKVVSKDSGVWYDYAEKKWANIMLSDGLVLDENNYVTTMGSMFVWIPRFAYSINQENYHQRTAGTINLRFLKGTTNLASDGQNINIEGAAGYNKWNVHPAFINGSKNNYANGGWNKEISGMWVAKFEASSSNPGDSTDPTVTNGGGNTTALNIKVKPGVKSWREISEDNIFQNCLNMNAYENIYGLPPNAISHQMKNSEWGAISYLTNSIYGKNEELYINNSTRYITGNSGGSTDETGYNGTANSYETENGMASSSTGNIYGIYDLSGGAQERMASYAETGTTIETYAQSINNLQNNEKHLVEIYTNVYNNTVTKFGDGIYETSNIPENPSINAYSWYNDASIFIQDDNPFIARGGMSNNGANAGIFAFYNDSGIANINIGFRPVIII